MQINRNTAAFMAQMRSPALNHLPKMNVDPSLGKTEPVGMQEIREKLSNMRVDVVDISPENAGVAGEEAKAKAAQDFKEMLAAYLPGGSKHELKLDEGVEGAYKGAVARVQVFDKYKEYLSMSEEHAKLSQSADLSDKERNMHLRMADEIKRYVAQSVSGHLDNPVQKDLAEHKRDRDTQVEAAIKQSFGSEALGQPSEDGYINDVDVLTGGAIGRLVRSVRGDISPNALGLGELSENYHDLSYQEMNDMLTAAQEKMKPVAERLGKLYEERTGKKPEINLSKHRLDPFTADTIKQGEWNLLDTMRFCNGFSDFVFELSSTKFESIALHTAGQPAGEAMDSRLSTANLYLD